MPPERSVDRPGDPGLDLLRRLRAELGESLRAVELALAAPAPGRAEHWRGRVHVALVELSADLHAHLAATEGPDGLHQEVLAAAPRLSHAVARLGKEHVALRTSLDHLLAAMESPLDIAAVEDIREQGTALLAACSRHRQRGADLVYEAYESDIGGET